MERRLHLAGPRGSDDGGDRGTAPVVRRVRLLRRPRRVRRRHARPPRRGDRAGRADGSRELLGQLPGGRISVAGLDTQTVAPHLVLTSDWLRRFCAHPLLAGLCRDLVGDDVRLYWEQAVYKQPESAEPVLWHQDNGYTFVEPQEYLTCWIAITDATLENGCVSVMPGAHRDRHPRAPRDADRLRVLGRPRRRGRRPGAGRLDRGVLVADAARHPAEPHIGGQEGVHRAVLPRRFDGLDPRAPDGSRGPGIRQDDTVRQFVVVRDGKLVGI